MIKIIFLDIDGVLNNEVMCFNPEWKEKQFDIDKRCMDLLNNLIEKTDAKVVISSVWRYGNTIESLQKLLEEYGFKGEVIGLTPSYGHTACVRGNEILGWLQDNQDRYEGLDYNFKNYVILDDDGDMLLFQKDNFIHVDNFSGLTPNIIWKAEKILNRNYNKNE